MDVTFFEKQSFFPKSSFQGEIQGGAKSWEEFKLQVSLEMFNPLPTIPLPTSVKPGVLLPLPTTNKPTKPSVPHKGRWKENVYSRKKHSHGNDKPNTRQCQEFEPIPAPVGSPKTTKDVEDEELNFPSKHSQSVEDIHLPIAIRRV